MTVGVLLPHCAPRPSHFFQPMAALQARFGDLSALVFHGPPEWADAYRALIGEAAYHEVRAGDCLDHDVFVVVQGESQESTAQLLALWPKLVLSDTCRQYMLDSRGCFQLSRGVDGKKMDDIEYPFRNTHVFNRLSWAGAGDRNLAHYAFFPYGYLFHYVGLGPLNEFGHRITVDLTTLAGRSPNHKVIACFGGSACWSTFCLHHQMWTQVLQEKLNEFSEKHALGYKFTVLNFGFPSNLVLNEMLSYTLFCHNIAPDIVIAHDGYNDLIAGQINDSFLLGRYQIGYVDVFEEWAQIFHQSSDRPLTQPKDVKRTINPAPSVLKAYVTRKKQFMRLVQGDGGMFVWGTQPGYFSKGELSGEERGRLSVDVQEGSAFREQILAMPHLYDQLTRRLSLPEGALAVDFHTRFQEFGADVELFNDHVHLRPEGDRVIADTYCKVLVERCFPSLRME